MTLSDFPTKEARHSNVDVLVVGAGPAGSMAINFLAVQGLHNIRLVDQSVGYTLGRADGFSARTQEILDSFGILDSISHQGIDLKGLVSWVPDPKQPGKMIRTDTPNVNSFSRYSIKSCAQGVGEEAMQKNALHASHGKVRIDRSTVVTKIAWDEERMSDYGDANYPISIQLARCDEAGNLTEPFEVVHAKYVIGCDGAHSTVRKSVGIRTFGESTSVLWGVIDGVIESDYPDSTAVSFWQSPSCGSSLFIPREKGLSRLYIDLSTAWKVSGQPALTREQVTAETILQQARDIYRPFKMEIAKEDIQWWSAYPVGQRLAERYCFGNRVFIAGDASHIHSPKEGSGMNVSIGDTYNIAWKIAHVLRGWGAPSLLATYEEERRPVAEALLALDGAVTKSLAKNGYSSDTVSLVMKSSALITGIGLRYLPSTIVGTATKAYLGATKASQDAHQKPANLDSPRHFAGASQAAVEMLGASGVVDYKLTLGGRFRTDVPLIRLHDSNAVLLTSLIPSDGRWRVIVFCGEVQQVDQMERLHNFAQHIESLQRKFTPRRIEQVGELRGEQGHVDPDSVVDAIVISRAVRSARPPDEYPAVFRPSTFATQKCWGTPPNGRRVRPMPDRTKLYVDAPVEHAHVVGHGDAYDRFGIEPSSQHGAVVVVRPDGYIALLCTLAEGSVLEHFFGQVLQIQS